MRRTLCPRTPRAERPWCCCCCCPLSLVVSSPPPCIEAEDRYGRSYAVNTHPYIHHVPSSSSSSSTVASSALSSFRFADLRVGWFACFCSACLFGITPSKEPASSASLLLLFYPFLCLVSSRLLSLLCSTLSAVAVCVLYLRGGCFLLPSLCLPWSAPFHRSSRSVVWLVDLFAAASPGCSGPLSIQAQQSLA